MIFLPTLVFDSKTRSQFRPACKKNQREISNNSQWPFSGGKCGNGKWYKERGNGIRRGENGIRRGENGIRRGGKWCKERGKWYKERGKWYKERGKWYKERGKWNKERWKCIIKSEIGFLDLILMTLDTPHGSNTKFLKKCGENEWEN